MLRLLFCSAVRCHSCGRRQFHFSPWGVAATVAVVLLIAFLVGVFVLAFWGDARYVPPPLESRQSPIGSHVAAGSPLDGLARETHPPLRET